MAHATLSLIKSVEKKGEPTSYPHLFEHLCTLTVVHQEGAYLRGNGGEKYDIFDLPEHKTFFIEGNLVLDSMDLEQLPAGINRVIVEKDLFIENNPLTTLENYPYVLGRTHINPIVRYVDNPKMARYTTITDLMKDGTLRKISNGKKPFFIGAIDAVFLKESQRPIIKDRHETLLKRCAVNAESLGFNNPSRVTHRFGGRRFDLLRSRD